MLEHPLEQNVTHASITATVCAHTLACELASPACRTRNGASIIRGREELEAGRGRKRCDCFVRSYSRWLLPCESDVEGSAHGISISVSWSEVSFEA